MCCVYQNIKLPCRYKLIAYTYVHCTYRYKDVFNKKEKKKTEHREPNVQHNNIRVLLEMLSLLYYFENIKTDFMKIEYKLSVVHITID